MAASEKDGWSDRQHREPSVRRRFRNGNCLSTSWSLFVTTVLKRSHEVTGGKNSVAVQYFAKLLGERGEGKRIIFAESRFEESQELQLLGTHILDTEVGVAFFNDPWRMQRDLLSSAADSYLDTMDFD